MKIYRRKYRNKEYYFVKMRQNGRFAFGCAVEKAADGKWVFRPNETFALSLLDREDLFPVAGEVGLYRIMKKAILEALGIGEEEKD